eukprot:TRINITY_DN23521_c0_g2_i4.p1 TRINITY_DN23521_c0_g2~~TRINITY_DN23521_c0_g2_i4.p1  ORF type:complete len:1060 (-),score=153.26 TRINITY_DN23521_c0_g2_i4:282-3329(-)
MASIAPSPCASDFGDYWIASPDPESCPLSAASTPRRSPFPPVVPDSGTMSIHNMLRYDNGEIHLASTEVEELATCPQPSQLISDNLAVEPEQRRQRSVESTDFSVASDGDAAPHRSISMSGLSDLTDFCIASSNIDRTTSQHEVRESGHSSVEAGHSVSATNNVGEKVLRFYSREDQQIHTGQLVRHVELLGRKYLMVRSEPSDEKIREGHQSKIHLFGMGFRNAKNNDIVLLGDGLEQGASDSFEESLQDETVEFTTEEPGLFVADHQRYRRTELLGSGGFADVYRYERVASGTSNKGGGRPGRPEAYAVKEVDIRKLSVRCGADQECLVRWIARLENEVRNQLKLRGHPGVVSAHDAFVHRGVFFIVMELVRGTDLGRRLQSRGRLPEADARRIFAQAAEALRHSHTLGIVHRDFKPGNVLLAAPWGPGGQECVKLVDFGLSKDITGADPASGAATPFLGTKYYRAPETRHRHGGRDVTKVDVFALGVTLYAMLCGQHPPEGAEVTDESLQGTALQRVSADAKDLLVKLLKHNPDERLCLDEAIEHPWLIVPWRVEDDLLAPAEDDIAIRATVDPDVAVSTRHLPPPRARTRAAEVEEIFALDDAVDKTDGGNIAWSESQFLSRELAADGEGLGLGPSLRKRPRHVGPDFQSAFPLAPASSSAAKIPADAGAATCSSQVNNGGPLLTSGAAPGWENVFSWLRADSATAAAQEVLCKAGMAPPRTAGFGRPPLVTRPISGVMPGQPLPPCPHRPPGPVSQPLVGPAPAPAASSTSAVCDCLGDSQRRVACAAEADGRGEKQPATHVGDHAATTLVRTRPYIRWITCAPRFASAWRFAQSDGNDNEPMNVERPSVAPLLSPPPSPYCDELTSAWDMPGTMSEGRSTPLDSDGHTTPYGSAIGMGLSSDARRGLSQDSGDHADASAGDPGAERTPSVIGFVHAPSDVMVDGLLVTITQKPLGPSATALWGFVSEVHSASGYPSREEAMRAAEQMFCTVVPSSAAHDTAVDGTGVTS